ncbi:hypothetical protein NF212_10895 [Parasalinivibrio latis]|uniref:tetratricopeptide repeat protein n=1 Tax=Parasalinivibrio latis TaxID=2952610 RepID=UPI0030DDE728
MLKPLFAIIFLAGVTVTPASAADRQADLAKVQEQLRAALDNRKISSEEYVALENGYQSLIKKYPDWWVGYDGLTTLALFRNDCDAAIEYAVAANRIQLNMPSYFALTVCYNIKGEGENALFAANAAYDIDPSVIQNPQYLIHAANAFTTAGKYEVAKNLLAKAIREAPSIKKDQNFLVAGNTLAEKMRVANNGVKGGESDIEKLCEGETRPKQIPLIETDGFSYETNKDRFYWMRTLMSTNFQFVEFCVNENEVHTGAPEKGCWRVSKSPKNDSCNQAVTDEYGNWAGYKHFFEKNCLVSEKIPRLDADYHLSAKEEKVLTINDKKYVTKHTQSVFDTAASKVVNQDVYYLRYTYTRMTGKYANSPLCKPYVPNWRWHWVLPATLRAQ